MLLLTSAEPKPKWQQTLASADERVLWAILAVTALFALAGLLLRWRRSKSREAGLAPPGSIG